MLTCQYVCRVVSSLLLQLLTRKNGLVLRRRHPLIRDIQFTGLGGCLLSFRDLRFSYFFASTFHRFIRAFRGSIVD